MFPIWRRNPELKTGDVGMGRVADANPLAKASDRIKAGDNEIAVMSSMCERRCLELPIAAV